MTNADVIKSMTDEQLARFLEAVEIGEISMCPGFCDICQSNICDECRTIWLHSDAEEGMGLLTDPVVRIWE